MRASRFSRSIAIGVDLVAGLALGVLLAPSSLGYYFSARAVVLLRIGEPDSWFVGPVAMVIGILGELVFLLPLALMLVLAPEAIVGRSLGKLVLRLRIEPGRAGQLTSLVTRYLLKTLPLLLITMALVTGFWWLQVVALVLAVLGVGQWALSGLRGSTATYDRLAGTVVSRVSAA